MIAEAPIRSRDGITRTFRSGVSAWGKPSKLSSALCRFYFEAILGAGNDGFSNYLLSLSRTVAR